MLNAHERFGTLEFTKRTRDTTTCVRVYIDRAVVEPPHNDRSSASAHLISLIGGDSEIGAVCAAVAEGALFRLQFPDDTNVSASLGPEAQCFRGSVMVPGRARPVRHLVAVSAELVKTKPGADREGTRTVLCDGHPMFVLYRIAYRYGLPAVPEWASWFMRRLSQRKAIVELLGLGCSPVLVKGNKQTFLKWIGGALKARQIQIPDTNRSVSWKLQQAFFETGDLRQTDRRRIAPTFSNSQVT